MNKGTSDMDQRLEEALRKITGGRDEIRREDFNKILQTKNPLFADRVFQMLDMKASSSGVILIPDFIRFVYKLTGGDTNSRIKFLFKVYDVNGDGLIQEDELEQVMAACMEENGLQFSKEGIKQLAQAFYEDAGVDPNGAMTFDVFKAQLGKYDGLAEKLTFSIDRLLLLAKPQKFTWTNLPSRLIPHQMTHYYLRNNGIFLFWLAVILVANVSLFAYQLDNWLNRKMASRYLAVAKAAGNCLDLDCTLILVLVLRQSLTFLRAHGASSYLPIDQHLYFHKFVGGLILLLGSVHTVAHLVNIEFTLSAEMLNTTYMEYLFMPLDVTKDFGLVPGFANNTGVIILMILLVMVACTLPFVRRSGYFEVFYWTHLLYYPFWGMMVIHSMNFYKWFVVPGLIFLLEQGFRFYHWRVGRGRTFVEEGVLLPSKVTQLCLKRPRNFHFSPGDYVFVRIPKIARWEWHPFTISSAPEQEGILYLHVRAVGEWTNRLYAHFKLEQQNLISNSNVTYLPGKSIPEEQLSRFPNAAHVTTDGPFSLSLNGICLPPLDVGQSPGVNECATADLTATNESTKEADQISPKYFTVGKASGNAGKCSEMSDRMVTFPQMNNLSVSPALLRSISEPNYPHKFCNGPEMPDSLPGKGMKRSLTIRDSFRYVRHKPQVISLHTPDIENLETLSEIDVSSQSTLETLAEEGRCPEEKFSPSQVTGISGSHSEVPEISLQKVGKPLEIFIDGPYGAPSGHIFRSEHAVLIAAGIGVTPFASILRSIMMRYWESRITCPRCDLYWCHKMPSTVFALRKVDFFWINREQRAFDWFVQLLSQLEIEQAELDGTMERFLDMHLYVTSALQRTDMKAVGLQLALDLLHEKEKRDLITGLKTRTNAGRPDWDNVFKQLKGQKKGKITVFFCGPPALGKTLKIKCDEFGFVFRKEVF